MNIIISNRSDQPIYEQIRNQIRAAIVSGELEDGEQLPSIRLLAADLKVSVITTKRAYDELQDEGFISATQGKGYYVLPRNKARIKELKLKEIEQSLSDAINSAKEIGLSNDELKETLEILLSDN